MTALEARVVSPLQGRGCSDLETHGHSNSRGCRGERLFCCDPVMLWHSWGPSITSGLQVKCMNLLHKMHIKNKVSCGFHSLVLNLSSQPLAELRTVCLSSFSSHKVPQTEARGGGRARAWTAVTRFSKFCSLVESPQ